MASQWIGEANKALGQAGEIVAERLKLLVLQAIRYNRWALLFFFFVQFWSHTALSAPHSALSTKLSALKHVVLVLLPAVSASDLNPKTMPQFRWLIEHGAVGLMNTRTAAFQWPRDAPSPTIDPARGSAYLTLGAGTRCAAGPWGSEGYLASERMAGGIAREVYHRRNLMPVASSAFQLNPALIAETNTGMGYRAQPGFLGDLLHRKGLHTAVLGEADRNGMAHREGVLAAMDSAGRVDFADFKISVPNAAAPFGREMSLPQLERGLDDALAVAQFIVLDWGDTARLDDEKAVQLPDISAKTRGATLRRLNALFGLLRRKLNFRKDALYLISPYPSRAARSAYDLLTPVIQVGGTAPGLLTSPSTRRTGVVANVDVAPTLASAFRETAFPSVVVGRPIVTQKAGDAWDRLMALRSRLVEVEHERRGILRDIESLLTWMMAIFAAIFVVGKGAGARWIPLTVWLIPVSIPLALLLLALVQWPSPGVFQTMLVGVTLLLAVFGSAVARLRRRAVDGLGVLALLTTGAVILDGLAGFPHMPYCILSYSLMEGARYYGIGNEYMGAFLAATALGGTALFRARRRMPALPARMGIAALFLLATVVLAGPAFGAKFGGAVASAGAFGLCLLLLFGVRLGFRQVLLIGGGIAAVIALMIAFDQMRGGQSSHVGRAFAAIQSGGWSELGLIIQRKASMNAHLLMHSPWSRLMGCGLLASLLGLRSRRLRGYPTWPEGALGAGVAGALAAALIAFLVDDAGVLAAATALIFVPSALASAEHLLPIDTRSRPDEAE